MWHETDLADGAAPMWSQIAERLRLAIKDGTFKPGEVLPGEAELNRRFGVSRTTSRAALDFLEAAGLITRKSGRGSIVVQPRVERPLNRLSSFSEDMHARGLKPGYNTRSLRLSTASVAVAKELGIAPNSPVFEIDRILLADASPMATSLTYLVPAMFKQSGLPTAADLDRGSLYAWLKVRAGIDLAAGRERIEGGIADMETAKILGLEQPAAVLVCHRTSWSDANEPVEYVVLNYRADRYSFHVGLAR
ncbi:GntR family transcriptional regulator [Phyllobacterium lublinensis]|uniref:GntR family transcriptional regulator n=1 Tax=Phyllobacterium lublinensis TaxID=2875708 RepID=UPI001CCEEF8F|nr:GntR family transcriptional regulator [Phyllobacterium sp. 2063]MBZ9656312.1 GntR family transcriptional regulator [Phyllobacterium sp. 2063]